MPPTLKPALLLAAVLAAAATATVPAAAQNGSTGEGARTVLDSVFTEAQAERGRSLYRKSCAGCHASGFFKGDPFRLVWSGQPASGFFELIRTRMPMDNPASLDPAEYAAIVAYILELNGYPAGERELPDAREELDAILIVDPPGSGGPGG